MSLEEIKQEAIKKRRRRGRRRFLASRAHPRDAAVMGGQLKQMPRFRPPNAALAVLRRARETAAAAAQAAADAAALIEQNRAEQAHFGPPPPFRRSRRGRRRGRGGRGGAAAGQTGTSRSDEEPPKTHRQRKSASYWARRREKRRMRRAQAMSDPYFYDPPPMEPYRFPPEPYQPVLDDYPGMMSYRGYDWQDLGPGPEPGFMHQPDRFAGPGHARYAPSRDDEYLAQARALIQAQNEQLNPGYRPPFEPWPCPAPFIPGEEWGPRSHMRSSRW
ncbi:unnamed protein product [Dicrocoelium dendriticum]|nr:unnamed protein product [Dicrocoelium dendriticum]